MGVEENIKSYNETFRILREAQNENRLVLFIGAGISADSGMPLWSEAIDKISKALDLQKQNDDTLKIPQYYYNSRGKKEYNEFMRKIFKYGEDLKTTTLHKKLIGLGTNTIITTNYDHLIEKAAQENGEVMQVVSQDIDLPYLRSGRQLIKIHGDFEHDNYVLKEDDYLHYSSNFKLIETYIKSIIGSKIVLFVGYYLSDPDIKHIFSWVKEILNQNFQRAYIIVTREEPNELKKDYFKNLGVNIIYASEFVENKNCGDSAQIIQVIRHVNEKEAGTKIEKLYNQIKQLKDLNYVYGKYIRRTFYKYGIICSGNNIRLFYRNNDDEGNRFLDTIWNYFEKDGKNECPKNIDNNYLKLIKQVIVKSQFSIMERRFDLNKKVEISNEKTNDIEEKIINFDYTALHTIMVNNLRNVSLTNPEICMQQAYICSIFGDYVLAYNFLKTASTVFYSSKSYVWYYIAMVNKKFVGQLLGNNLIGKLSDEERQAIASEAKAIDLDKIMNSIPNTDDSDYYFLKELGSFNVAYTLFYDVFKDSVKSAEEAKTYYSVYTGMTADQKLQIAVKDYISYLYRNYIILDRYTETISIFVLYIRSILSSVNSADIEPDPNEKLAVGNVHLDKIGKFELFIMIKYLSVNQIKKMFKEYEIKILPIDKMGQDYIEQIFASVSLYSKYVKIEEDIFWRYLELVSHIEITSDLTIKIFDKIFETLSKANPRIIAVNEDTVVRFVINVCNQQLYSNIKICDAAKKIIDKMIDEDFYIDLSNLLKHLLYLCYKGNKAYNNVKRISKLAKQGKIKLLINIYDKLSVKPQNQIKNAIDCWRPESFYDYCYYCEAALVGALEWNEKVENELYDLINKGKEGQDKDEQSNNIIIDLYPNYNESDLINALCNLYLNKKIINESKLKEIADKSSMELPKWLLNMDTFDYSKFDCQWLETSSPSLLKSISKNPIAVKGILEAYKTQYESKAISTDVTDIIIKYFIIT